MFGRRNRERAARAQRHIFEKILRFPRNKKSRQQPQEHHHTDDEARPTTTPQGSPPIKSSLRVNMTVRFESSLDKNYDFTYDASPHFDATDEVCEHLLHRIEHCSNELITRSDEDSCEPIRLAEPRTKLARYHLFFRIDRQGMPWKELHFTSFQEQPITIDTAQKIVLEADHIVCLFLHWNDGGFVWRLPSIVTTDPLKHKSTHAEIGLPQAMDCIPTYNGEPGYSIDLTLRTKGYGPSRTWSVKVDSEKNTPLTLHLGENLMSQVTAILQRAIREREERFAEIHRECDALEGSHGCRHFREAAFDMIFKIRNNFGPDYPHFSNRFQTCRQLITQGQGAIFVKNLERSLEKARELADEEIEAMDDLVLTIHELRSQDWKVTKPLTIILDSSDLKSRIVTERILERVQTGMTSVLRGYGVVAELTAHKRGHLVLETTICRGEDTRFYDLKLFDSLHLKKRVLQQRIKNRMQEDIAMVLKDTVSIVNEEELPNMKIITPGDATVELLPHSTNGEHLSSGSRRLIKKPHLFNLRRRSLEEEEAAKPEDQEQLVQDYGYMADMVSERSESLRIQTPSLADTASINLQDGAKTPPSTRVGSQAFATGLGMFNFDDVQQASDKISHKANLSSSSSVIHNPQAGSNNATKLLASYWDTASAGSFVQRDPEGAVARDFDSGLNIWKDHPTDKKGSGLKQSLSSDTVSEASWLGAKEEDETTSNVQCTPLGPISDNATPMESDSEKKPAKAIKHQTVARSETSINLVFIPSWEETVQQVLKSDSRSQDHRGPIRSKSQALVLRQHDGSLRLFSRGASALLHPSQSFIHAQGLVDGRRFSFPAGAHLGLHREWSIEMGLRNALVPPHLREAYAGRRAFSCPTTYNE